MSPQIVVDEQINYDKVTAILKRLITAEQIGTTISNSWLTAPSVPNSGFSNYPRTDG